MSEVDLPVIEFAFPGPLRESLIAAIQSGIKTTTSSLMREYKVADEPLPMVGTHGIVIDSIEAPVCVVETVDVQVVRLSDVPLAHATAEGEGYMSVAQWRAGHLKFWESAEMRAELGADFTVTDSTLIVLERFTLVRP